MVRASPTAWWPRVQGASMPFDRLHAVVTYALVLCGFTAIALSGEIPPIVLIAFSGAVVASWFVARWLRPVGPVVGNVVVLAVLALLVLDGVSSGRWLLNALYFALFITASKLFQRHLAKDYAQLYTLSFLLVTAGSVMNPGLSFGLLFLVYIVFLTWGLVLLHLRKDMEERAFALARLRGRPEGELGDEEPALWKAQTLVTPKFLFGTSLLAIFVFVASMLSFFLFPRVGLGFFFAFGREGQQVAGFSERVELGHFGTIKDNPEVIARVILPDTDGPPSRPLRLRGISFDHYDGQVWSRKVKLPAKLPMPSGPNGELQARVNRERGWPSRLVTQQIYLEPMQSDLRVLFGLPVIRSLEVNDTEVAVPGIKPRRYYQGEPSGDITYTGRAEGGVVYEVVSELPIGVPPGLKLSGTDYPHLIKLAYLQLPPIDPGIETLAAERVAGASSTWEKANRIQSFLRGDDFRYTLQGDHDPDDPLADFVLERREGHCEYFASAMVVMLRSVGVPARVVNGFLGGVWNPFGEYVEMRQGDAHAWVEVYFPGFGWWTFDPTPSGGQLAPQDESAFAFFDRWVDSLKLQWFKWVVEYDLQKQLGLFRDFGRKLASFGRDLLPSLGASSVQPEAKSKGRNNPLGSLRPRTVATVILALLVLVFLVWLIRRRFAPANRERRPPSEDAVAARKNWQKLLKLAERRGLGLRASTTPQDVVTWVETRSATDPPSSKAAERSLGPHAVREAAAHYEAIRFGQRALTPEAEAAFRDAYATLRFLGKQPSAK